MRRKDKLRQLEFDDNSTKPEYLALLKRSYYYVFREKGDELSLQFEDERQRRAIVLRGMVMEKIVAPH